MSEPKIKPSDRQLSDAILAQFEATGADSAGSAKGPFAIFNLLKEENQKRTTPHWMLAPQRVSNLIDDLVEDKKLVKIPKNRKYYKPKKEDTK
jgi:hypothetical protein